MVLKARSGDPIARLLQPQGASGDPIANLIQSETMGLDSAFSGRSELAELEPYGSTNLTEAFVRGVRGGVERLGADIAYFGAAWDAVTGDEEEKADAIENARIREEFAQVNLAGMSTLDDALENPTIYGFLEAAASGFGQVTPQLATVVASAGVGSIAVATGQGILRGASKSAARNIIKDSVEATAKGTATTQQARIAQASYEALKEAHVLQRNAFFQQKARKKGMLGGAYAATFVPLTAGNVRDTLESDRELDAIGALRSYAVAVPQAAIGLAGEAGLVALIGKEALKKSSGKNSVMGRLADVTLKAGGRGALVEGTAEYLQEEIAIQNRQQMDPDYTDEEANSRRLNALFLGSITGGGVAGGGAAAIQGGREIANSDIADASIKTAANVIERAAYMRNSIRDLMTRSKSDAEIAGADPDQTIGESERDVNAQLNAMFDPTSSKQAVWIAGTKPDSRFANRERPRKLSINGKEAYSAFIPGRGTIISTQFDVVEAVVKGGATDAVLAEALGYSAVKTGAETEVVRVYDKDGGIVSEQVFAKENLKQALDAAKKLQPEGGRTEILDVEQALAERARRKEEDFKFMEMDADEDVDPMEADQETNEEQFDGEFQSEVTTHVFTDKNKNPKDRYEPVKGENTYDDVPEARAQYIEEFGDVDFTDPFYAQMGASMLKTAVRVQEANPDQIVRIEQNEDGTYRIDLETTPDTQKIRIRDGKGNEQELSMYSFLRQEIDKAKSALPKFRTFSVKSPGSEKFVGANPVDLMNAGRRINEANSPGEGFTGRGAVQSAKQGLITMLGELQLHGYEIEVKDVPIADILTALDKPTPKNVRRLPKEIRNITVAFTEGNKPFKLESLLRSRSSGAGAPALKFYAPERVVQSQRRFIVEGTGEELVDMRMVETPAQQQEKLEVIQLDDGRFVRQERVTVSIRNSDLATRMEQGQDERAEILVEGDASDFAIYDEDNPNAKAEPIDIIMATAAQESERNQGFPLTRLNIEEVRNVDSTQNRPLGRAPTMGPESEKVPKRKPDLVGAVTMPFDGLGDTVVAMSRRLSRKVKLQTPLAVIGLKGFQDATRAQLAALVSPKLQKSAMGKRYLEGLKKLDLTDKMAVGRFIRFAEQQNLFKDSYAAEVRSVKSLSALGNSAVRIQNSSI